MAYKLGRICRKNTTTGGYKLKSGVTATVTEVGSKTTDTSGVVKFEELPLGLYLVLETETPDSVKTACEPFFVSVPMTKSRLIRMAV